MSKKVEFSNGRWTERYFVWQLAVFKRDGFECQHCHTTEKLHAHHIIEWDADIELRYELSNGLTLCSSCHFKHHSKGRAPWNKGKKLSEEGRKKLSDAHKGQKAWNTGLKMSNDFCKKASEVRMGVKRGPHSEEHKKKIGLANTEILKKNAELRKGKSWYKCPETGKRVWVI